MDPKWHNYNQVQNKQKEWQVTELNEFQELIIR